MPRGKRLSFKIKTPDGEVETTAGGVLLYRRRTDNADNADNAGIDLLLSFNRSKYEDLGGTVEEADADIRETIAREVEEESNGMISATSIRARISGDDFIYSRVSKYVLFVIEATEQEAHLTSDDFGPRELHDDFERTIRWVPLTEFLSPETIRDRLNFRLKNRPLFDKVSGLQAGVVGPGVDVVPDEPTPASASVRNTVYLF